MISFYFFQGQISIKMTGMMKMTRMMSRAEMNWTNLLISKSNIANVRLFIVTSKKRPRSEPIQDLNLRFGIKSKVQLFVLSFYRSKVGFTIWIRSKRGFTVMKTSFCYQNYLIYINGQGIRPLHWSQMVLKFFHIFYQNHSVSQQKLGIILVN